MQGKVAKMCVEGCLAILRGEKWPQVADKSDMTMKGEMKLIICKFDYELTYLSRKVFKIK